jgi:predicted adenine nucleotide alpha hydrolase (AANH) superfamily ATPase
MARPLSSTAEKLIAHLDETPCTLATAADELGIDYMAAAMLISRLKYARQVLVIRKERHAHCRKPVALYATPQWWERNKDKEAA